MSLTKEAIEKIQELTAASAAMPSTFFEKVALPTDVRVIDLEEFQEHRNHFSGKLSTDSIKDFGYYCNNQLSGACFINKDDMVAVTIFDLGTTSQPGHCKHRAIVELNQTSIYHTLKKTLNTRVSQQDLAEFIEDWRDDMSLTDEHGEIITVVKAIAAVRKVTIKASADLEKSVGSYSESTSSMDKLDVKSGEDNLPGYILFRCNPFHGLKGYNFNIRIRLMISRDKIEFMLRPVKIEQQEEEMGEEFSKLITDYLDPDIPSYMGVFRV